jgi:N-sulfoglucosamine sulfohydrolase
VNSILVSAFGVLIFGLYGVAAAASPSPNLLLITVDDMNTDSVGVFGSTVPATTPNIDRLAREGLRFEMAHVQVANCTPSRNVMWSGRYPHTNKIEGFYQVKDPGYETLSDLLQRAGYFTAIRHKVNSSTPFYPYGWDLVLDGISSGGTHHRKDAGSYGLSTMQAIKAANTAGKPFSILINIADPHFPHYGLNKKREIVEDEFTPSRIYEAEEVSVPGFLFDDPVVRQELSHYYSSVRRADDAVGEVMKALEDSGAADDTLVMFLSDHGMPFPFAKTQLYHHSTSTPLIFRWPGVIEKNTVDDLHMVSAVDILPTLLSVIGAQLPEGIEGRSFLPILRGQSQHDRDKVFKEYNENSSGQRAPMRAVQDTRFLYIFNPWSDGERSMNSATLHTDTYTRMEELAQNDAQLAKRVSLLKYRVVEEFYDVRNDPDCLINLIANPAYQTDIEERRSALEKWMRDTQDHALNAFINRADKKALAVYMDEQKLDKQKSLIWKRAIRDAMSKKRREPVQLQESAESRLP